MTRAPTEVDAKTTRCGQANRCKAEGPAIAFKALSELLLAQLSGQAFNRGARASLNEAVLLPQPRFNRKARAPISMDGSLAEYLREQQRNDEELKLEEVRPSRLVWQRAWGPDKDFDHLQNYPTIVHLQEDGAPLEIAVLKSSHEILRAGKKLNQSLSPWCVYCVEDRRDVLASLSRGGKLLALGEWTTYPGKWMQIKGANDKDARLEWKTLFLNASSMMPYSLPVRYRHSGLEHILLKSLVAQQFIDLVGSKPWTIGHDKNYFDNDYIELPPNFFSSPPKSELTQLLKRSSSLAYGLLRLASMACEEDIDEDIISFLLQHTNAEIDVATFMAAVRSKNEPAKNVGMKLDPDLERFKMKLAPYSEDSERFLSPLLLAVRSGKEATVQMLLNLGAHIEASVQEEWSGYFGDFDVHLHEYYGLGQDWDQEWEGEDYEDASLSIFATPLWFAVAYGNYAIARLLLEHGAEIEPIFGWHERTPLQMAKRSGNKAMVRLLLKHGAKSDV